MSRIVCGVIIIPLAISCLACPALAGRGSELDTPAFMPGQIVLEFEPGVVDLPASPGRRFIPLEDVPILKQGLKARLQALGISTFEIFARHWRNIDPVVDPDSLRQDHAPVMLKSFRDYYVLHFPMVIDLDLMVDEIAAVEGIRSVGRNPMLISTDHWPCDSLVSYVSDGADYQWALENTGGKINGIECVEGIDIGMRGAWAIQETCTVKIGLLDSGVDRDHEDLEDNLDADLGRNFATPPNDTLAWDDGGTNAGHGTKSAGIVGGIHSSDSTGIAGICGLIDETNTEPVIVPLKIWSNAAAGDTAGAVCTWMIDALSYAAGLYPEIPILVIEAILPYAEGSGGSAFSLTDSEYCLLRNAFYNAFHEGLLLAVAAGNVPPGDAGEDLYPPAFRDMVVGVGAVGCDGVRPPGFPSGANIDVCTPGSGWTDTTDTRPQVISTDLEDAYDLHGGTSAAVPHVGAVAGLLLSHTGQLTNEDLRGVMEQSCMDLGTSGPDAYYGRGLIQADSALGLLDSHLLVHDSTSSIDSYTIDVLFRERRFRNVNVAITPSPDVWDTLWADVYKFETTVDLDQNTNPDHTPNIWIRGRQSLLLNVN